MEKRKALTIIVTIAAFVGVALVAVPFITSMSPGMKVKEDAKVRVKLSEVPDIGALEVDLRGYRVFLLRKPQLTAFVMPYWGVHIGCLIQHGKEQ